MKKNLFLLIAAVVTLVACKSNSAPKSTNTSLEGAWELNYISGPRIAFGGLFPNKKPTISFNLKENKVSGNNSCNQYFGLLKIEGNKINFKDAKMGMTRMACFGEGDTIYMKTLEKIDSYSISNDGKTLNLNMGDIALMRFFKK